MAEYLASKLLIDCDHTLAKLVKDTLSVAFGTESVCAMRLQIP